MIVTQDENGQEFVIVTQAEREASLVGSFRLINERLAESEVLLLEAGLRRHREMLDGGFRYSNKGEA